MFDGLDSNRNYEYNEIVGESRDQDLYNLEFEDDAERLFPFAWQGKQRQHLRSVLPGQETTLPGVSETSLVLYAQYAIQSNDEKVIREGMRRDPDNALYNYLLANLFIQQSTESPKIYRRYHEYSITNRKKLDQAMQQVVSGQHKPLRTYRDIILSKQIAAMPETRDFYDRLHEDSIFAKIPLSEITKLRNIARVNSYYLSALLAEGKRAQAEPFFHTGEHLVVQISNDSTLLLTGQFIALAVGNICEKNDARVCRSFGLNKEAKMIEQRMDVLVNDLREWKEHGRTKNSKEMNTQLYRYGGIRASIVLPLDGTYTVGLITKKTLAPSRLVEYVVAERAQTMVLSLFSFLLLLYAWLKYLRGKLVIRDLKKEELIINLSASEWLKIVLFGLFAPLALYLLYIAIPVISISDQTMPYAARQFAIGIGVFSLLTLIVPVTMAAGYLWQRGITQGDITIQQRWQARWNRLRAAIISGIWAIISFVVILIPFSWPIFALILGHFTLKSDNQLWLLLCSAVVMLLLPIMPAIWQKKHTSDAPFHLNMARVMMLVYAVMTLFFASLVPVTAAFERHYIQSDTVTSLYHEGNDISLTMVEGQLCKILRQGVRDGAVKLGISWE